MKYNTQQKKMALPEYGRSVQNMVDYAVTIEDVEMLRFMENGYRIKILEVVSDSIGVDNPEDIAKVEAVLNSNAQ